MTLLSIIVAPDPRLRVEALPVEHVNAEIVTLMSDMLETMYAAPGVGLAAPQVGVARRVIVIDISSDKDPSAPLRMANPEIVWFSEEQSVGEEGCLSLPNLYENVRRSERVTVRYLDETGQSRILEASGFLATCIQHEIDHLNGTLFVDHITVLKRNMFLRKLSKGKKTGAIRSEYIPTSRDQRYLKASTDE